jgi:hypothetical protein
MAREVLRLTQVLETEEALDGARADLPGPEPRDATEGPR